MSEQNPYAVNPLSDSESLAAGADPSQHPLMQELLTLLSQTRPWVRLFSILSAIGAVLLGLAGAAFVSVGESELTVMGVTYMAMAGLYVYPALCLSRYATRIQTAEATGEMVSVVDAVREQKKFWRFCGIVAAVIFIIYALIFVVAFLGGLLWAML